MHPALLGFDEARCFHFQIWVPRIVDGATSVTRLEYSCIGSKYSTVQGIDYPWLPISRAGMLFRS